MADRKWNDMNNDGKVDWKDYTIINNLAESNKNDDVEHWFPRSSSYVPTSINPYITSQMLKSGLAMVTLKQGPANCQDIINRKLFRLVIDDTRKKVLAVWNVDNKDIIIDINICDIASVICTDAGKPKENRHRFVVNMINGDFYEFYVEIPYQFDPLPFVTRLQSQIYYLQHPEAVVRNNHIGTLACIGGILFFALLAAIYFSTESIGWGIFSSMLSVFCGYGAYYGLKNW